MFTSDLARSLELWNLPSCLQFLVWCAWWWPARQHEGLWFCIIWVETWEPRCIWIWILPASYSCDLGQIIWPSQDCFPVCTTRSDVCLWEFLSRCIDNKQPSPGPHVGDPRMSNLWQYSGEDSRFYYLQNRTVSLKCDSLPLCHGAQESGICARDLETHQCTCAHHFSWRGGQSVRRDQKNA